MNKTQLENYTIAQLQAEIDRQLTEKNKPIPELLPMRFVHMADLNEICRDYIAFLASDDYHEDNDWKDYIFEVALETTYGKNVWEWIRERMR